ncbi:MAG: HpaII family restriction endonuclease, partial [Bacteroides sp.]
GYYRHKMRKFLLALALGLCPAKIYTGRPGAIGGMLLVQTDGSIVLYDITDTDTFAEFLYQNSRLLKGDVEKDKYGFLERENGVYYFKLNVKVGLLKR